MEADRPPDNGSVNDSISTSLCSVDHLSVLVLKAGREVFLVKADI